MQVLNGESTYKFLIQIEVCKFSFIYHVRLPILTSMYKMTYFTYNLQLCKLDMYFQAVGIFLQNGSYDFEIIHETLVKNTN